METSPFQDMRVLIADDQRDVGRSLAELVCYCNHEVVAVVGSGLEAINAYSLHHPDLVLMDYRMPKLNGGTACRHIIAKDPAARIILVTAWSPSDEIGASGAIAILPKPVALDRLNALLESVAQTLPVPSPDENVFNLPTPNFDLPAQSSDLQALTFDFPAPSSDLQAPTFDLESPYFPPVADPLPVDPPSVEIAFVDPAQIDLQQIGETVALAEEKIPVKRRRNSNRRRPQRVR